MKTNLKMRKKYVMCFNQPSQKDSGKFKIIFGSLKVFIYIKVLSYMFAKNKQ